MFHSHITETIVGIASAVSITLFGAIFAYVDIDTLNPNKYDDATLKGVLIVLLILSILGILYLFKHNQKQRDKFDERLQKTEEYRIKRDENLTAAFKELSGTIKEHNELSRAMKNYFEGIIKESVDEVFEHGKLTRHSLLKRE